MSVPLRLKAQPPLAANNARELVFQNESGVREIAQLRAEVEMAKIAANGELTLEEIAARLEGIREQSASRERIFAAEAAIEGRKPAGAPTAGGYL